MSEQPQEFEEPAWHDGTMSPEVRATLNRSEQPQKWTTTAEIDGDLAIVEGTKLIGVAATVRQAVAICWAYNAALADMQQQVNQAYENGFRDGQNK
jgi:hypothetical protein